MFEEIKNIKTRKKEIKSFGITIGIILLVIGAFLFFKGNAEPEISYKDRNGKYQGQRGVVGPRVLSKK